MMDHSLYAFSLQVPYVILRYVMLCCLLILFDLTSSIPYQLRRIFQVGLRPFSDGREGGFGQTGMSFPDFIFFMLAEEDKSSDAALRYW
jgi:hypothetical protein